jgi:hypothetical protein
MRIFKITGGIDRQSAVYAASLRCPGCRQLGVFERILVDDLVLPGGVLLGQRCCPNPECHAHVFLAYDATQRRVLVSYPAERIDFDPANIPPTILKPLNEAVTCHANACFVAAAIMVRKTLEELCHDRGAGGNDLKARIQSLQTKVVLPKELFDGLDDLRLLGNDAAHVESRVYDNVGQQEVEVALEFTKEVLKAVYQYSALLARLRSLKKTP